MKILKLVVVFLLLYGSVLAQENETDPVRDYIDSVRFTRQQIELIQNLKFSGYYQFQFQMADTAGINSFEGGNFAADVNNRFTIRRGRLKMTYNDKLTTYVLQFDATERGVAIRDAYIKLTEKKFKKFALTAGIFDKPFGYEISYSSRLRESPERGRMSQILFSNERDIGAMINYHSLWNNNKKSIKIEAGLFNGSGFLTPEFDSKKDFIARVNFENNTKKLIKYGLGASMYSGKLVSQTKDIYKMSGSTFVADSNISNIKRYVSRNYFGINAQLNFFSSIGFTIIRAEYIFGAQPGTSLTSASPIVIPVVTNTYLRNFNGAYLYFVQNILKSKHQLVLKYDWYDPNTLIAGKVIGAIGSNTTITDVKFTTFGVGYIYRASDHIRWTLYYDFVRNEKTSISGTNSITNYTKDLKDNVATIRMQYRF